MTTQKHRIRTPSPESRAALRDVLPGIGLVLGAGAGMAVGVVVAGAPGIAAGLLGGAGLGLVIGAALRATRPLDRQ